jgi:hypothetical protein
MLISLPFSCHVRLQAVAEDGHAVDRLHVEEVVSAVDET